MRLPIVVSTTISDLIDRRTSPYLISPIRFGTSDATAGTARARAVPKCVEAATICHTRRFPEAARPASQTAGIPGATFAYPRRRGRSTRSASTPPHGSSATVDSTEVEASTPGPTFEPVTRETSHAVTVQIHELALPTKVPARRYGKRRCRSEVDETAVVRPAGSFRVPAPSRGGFAGHPSRKTSQAMPVLCRSRSQERRRRFILGCLSIIQNVRRAAKRSSDSCGAFSPDNRDRAGASRAAESPRPRTF